MLSSQFRQALGASFLLLACLFYSFSSFAAESSVATYDELVKAIRETHHLREQKIEQAVDQETVREAWTTGHLIQEHILLNKDRAKYGEKVIERLAGDLDMSETELQYRVAFAKEYPISQPAGKLSWSHYQALLSINDSAERETVAKEADKENWSRKVLRKVIKERKVKTTAVTEPPKKLPVLDLGKTGTYQIVKINDHLKVDLGFEVYHDIPEKYEDKMKKGKYIAAKGAYFADAPQAKANDLYTYNAVVLDVVDGDTFHAVIDLGFETSITQRLRLRRLDAPEIISKDGKEAKKVLEKILNRSNGGIKLKVSKTDDQYGRYLVDVWVKDEQIDQELLDTNLFTART